MPAIRVEFTTDIQATADKLWDILTDVDSWPQWQGTQFVELSEPGRVKKGSKFTAELGGRKWALKVTRAERPFDICWQGRNLGIEAIHDWKFSEELEGTRAVTSETMSGWGLFLLYPIVKRRLSKYDEKWLFDLKLKAETI
jgi:uncharacterized protein YndB with AHSA1/START domain